MDSAASDGLSARDRAGDRAAKNTLVRAGGELVGRLASLVLFAALARSAGEPGLGIFVFAFAWAVIVTTPSTMGLERYFVRRVARDRSRVEETMDIVGLKLAVGVPVVVLSFVVALLLDFDAQTRGAIFLLTPGLLLDSLARAGFSVFTAHERSELLAVALLAQRFSAAALGLTALAAGLGVVGVAGAYTVGGAIELVVALVLVQRHIARLPLLLNPPAWRGLMARSLPFGAQDALGVLIARIDAVILAFLASDAAVGRYGAAYRLVESTFLVTLSVSGAFVAMYTYLSDRTEPTLRGAFQRSIKLSLAVLTPIAVTLAAVPEPVMELLFGADFGAAAEALRLLAPTSLLIGVVTLSSSLLVARSNPMTMVWVTAAMVALNVGLNFALIPAYEDSGAALAMTVTAAFGGAVCLGLAARRVGGLGWASMAASPLLAGAAMSAPMLLLGQQLGLALGAGAVVYLTVLVTLERLINPSDLEFLGQMARRRLTSRPSG